MPVPIAELLGQDSPDRDTASTSPTRSRNGSPPAGADLSDSENEEDNLLPQPGTQNPRKRPAEDHAAFCMMAARNVRLKKDDERALVQFSKLSSPLQRITMYARLLGMRADLQAITAVETVYHIPTNLDGRLERLAFAVLLSPDCANYVGQKPVNFIVTQLEKHPHWGFTPDVKNDKAKFKTITHRIRKLLTGRRNVFKTMMKTSLGYIKEGARDIHCPNLEPLDIVELCETAISTGSHIIKRDLKVSIPMMARFAFLRKVLLETLEDPKADIDDYWKKVDSTLKDVREAKKTPARMTRFFLNVLEEDCKLYGEGNRADLTEEVVDPIEFDDVSDTD